MKYKAVIFDLDGTLLDSLPDIASSMNILLKRLGFPVHETHQYRYLVGEGIRELVKRALPENAEEELIQKNKAENVIDDLVVEYRKIYNEQWKIQTKPYEGVSDMLNALSEQRVRMAVLSNKLDDFTKQMVAELLGNWSFEIVFGTRPGVPLKPDPAAPFEIARKMNVPLEEFIFVGDSGIDMQTAVNSDIFPVGVLWGLRDRQELLANGAQKLIRHPLELLEFFN